MPRGGFGRGFGGGFGRGFGMRRMGVSMIAPMGMGWGMGSPLMTTLMAGGLGYMMGNNSAQQATPQYPPYPYPYPYQASPAVAQTPASNAQSPTLAQLQLLGQLHDSGTLTDDEFESEKQRILRG